MNQKNETDPTGNSEPTVNIENFHQLLPDISDQVQKAVERMLYNDIKLNNDSFTHSIEVKIKKDSLIKKSFSDAQLTYYNFVVDIPSLEQEYQINLNVTPDKTVTPDDGIVISCLEDKIKYKDFTSRVPEGASTKFNTISQYIDYAGFDDIHGYTSEDNMQEIIVDITGSDKTGEEAVSQVQEWIKTMGYSTDDFIFNIYNG